MNHVPFYVLFRYLNPHELLNFSMVRSSFREEIYYKARPIIDIKTLEEGSLWLHVFKNIRFRLNNKKLTKLDYKIYQLPMNILIEYLTEFDIHKMASLHPYLFKELYDKILEFKWMKVFNEMVFPDIPEKAFNIIINQIRGRNININSPELIRPILKELGMYFYDRCEYFFAIRFINPAPPMLSKEYINKITLMLKKIEKSFEKYRGNRLNGLYLPYVLDKILIILGLTAYSDYLLRGVKKKFGPQEIIWINICKDLNYPIIQSIRINT